MNYLPHSKVKKYREANKSETCPIFEIPLDDVVVDHDHSTGLVRGCIHRQANAWEGKVFNAWKRYGGNNANVKYSNALRNLADYIDRESSGILHPKGVTDLCKRFSRLSKENQLFSLKLLGYKNKEINACINSRERVKLYRQFLTQNKYE